jgi:probable F420-dependent oxidoreductase
VDPTALSFGVNLGRLGAEDRPDGDPFSGPVESARWAEDAGFDVVTVADHVGSPSPFVMLAAAAAVTSRVRLRTYVLDVGLWNAGLLARDIATLDAISGGRVEVGLGAGHMRHEHDAVGLPFPPYAERLQGLDALARDLAGRLAAEDLGPRPVQRPVPLLLAAMSPAGLAVAALHGDVVALSGLLQAPGAPGGTFVFASSEQTDERVELVKHARKDAGLGPAGFDALLQHVVLDRDPGEVAAEFERVSGGRITAAATLDTPFVLLATSPEEAAKELVRRAERWGITSWCTHAPSGPALARVIAEVRA